MHLEAKLDEQIILGQEFEILGEDSDSSDNIDDNPPTDNQYCETTAVGEGEVNFDNMQDKSPSTTSGSCAENLAF